MKHKAIRVDNLMYKGCEPHWKCTLCGDAVPFHCYTKEELERALYLSECSRSAGIRAINEEKSEWLSVLICNAEKYMKKDNEKKGSEQE